MTPTPKEEYLGDGLYVSFDGYQLCLRAPREGGDHVTYLEPSVWGRLVAYVASLSLKDPSLTSASRPR